jgi:hypothetical protein
MLQEWQTSQEFGQNCDWVIVLLRKHYEDKYLSGTSATHTDPDSEENHDLGNVFSEQDNALPHSENNLLPFSLRNLLCRLVTLV